MKLSAILFMFFAGAIMAAPVPDNSIHERGKITPSTPIEERGIAGGLVKGRGIGLKKPVVERARLTPSVPIEKRGEGFVKKPIAERARLTPSVPIEERGEALAKKPIAERGASGVGAGAGWVEERGDILVKKPIVERGASTLKHPIEERGIHLPDVGKTPDVVVGAGGDHE